MSGLASVSWTTGERNEVQRWLFRRELEALDGQPVFYLDECGVDHRLYREYGRSPRGERIYQEVCGKRRERTSIIAASRQNKMVAPLVFQGSCNTEVVDVYFAEVLLPVLPPYSPDLNPIEHLWAALKTRLRQNLPTASNPFLFIANMSQRY